MYDDCEEKSPSMERGVQSLQAERPTVTLKLTRKRDRLAAELAKVNEVIAVLEKHPDAQEVLDAVSSLQGII